MASLSAVTINALITLVWLRMRSGAPDLGALVQTGARTLVIACLAAAGAFLTLRGLVAYLGDSAFLALVLGGASYGVIAVGATRFIGDGPLQAGLSSVFAKVSRLLGRGRGQRGQ